MSELEPFGTAGVGIYGIKKAIDGLDRVFGPMADEVAEALRRWTAYRLRNVGRVVVNAAQKTGQEDEGRQVPFRAAAKILEEAALADDDLMVEYVGGVLASARSPEGKDDRGVAWSAVIGRLAIYDLQAHYTFYAAFSRVLRNRDIEIYNYADLDRNARVYLSYEEFYASTDWHGTDAELDDLFAGALYALRREDLISLRIAGSVSHIASDYRNAKKDGIIVSPTVNGIRLAMWAMGRGQETLTNFLGSSHPRFHIEGKVDPTQAVWINPKNPAPTEGYP